MSKDDQHLMLCVADGDLEAFALLVQRHQEKAWRLAWRMLRDRAEAEDAVQQAFLKILEAAARYRPTASFEAYLSCVVTRHCRDRLRKKKPTYVEHLPVHPDQTLDPSKQLELREDQALFWEAVDDLPLRQHTAVTLYHFQGLSYEETAAAMECSVKAVEHLLARARMTLAHALRELAGEVSTG